MEKQTHKHLTEKYHSAILINIIVTNEPLPFSPAELEWDAAHWWRIHSSQWTSLKRQPEAPLHAILRSISSFLECGGTWKPQLLEAGGSWKGQSRSPFLTLRAFRKGELAPRPGRFPSEDFLGAEVNYLAFPITPLWAELPTQVTSNRWFERWEEAIAILQYEASDCSSHKSAIPQLQS